MSCVSCGRGLCDECESTIGTESPCCCNGAATTQTLPQERKRSKKDDGTLIDPTSTWRKRATQEYPLDREAECEWRNLADCGGGKYPIVGCTNGKQQTIHHGPVKIDSDFSYNFNIRTDDNCNVHRICTRCHALWHYWNDTPYTPEVYANLHHRPREARPNELIVWANAKTRPVAPEPRMTPLKVKED